MTIEAPEPTVRTNRRLVRAGLCFLGAIMLVAVAAGVFAASSDHPGGPSTIDLVLIGGFVAAGLALLVRTAFDVRVLNAELNSLPRAERTSTRFLAFALIAGAAGGLVAALLPETTGWFDASGPGVPAPLAIGFAILSVTLAPWVTWRWWRLIDEHERDAYAEGANVASHAVLCGGMAWYGLYAGRLAPEPDAMILILLLCTVWSAVWLYRKYF